MANTKALVKRRKSVVNTRKITKTMEKVATARLAKAQAAAIAARPYAKKLQQVIGDLASASSDIRHPLLETHDPVKKAVVIVLTSDRGLCGGFNANIIRAARDLNADLEKRGLQIERVVQGKKGINAFRYLNFPIAKTYVGVSDRPTYARAEEIADSLIDRYGKKEIDEAYIVYSSFISMTTQRPKAEKILPLSSLKGDEGGAKKDAASAPAAAKSTGAGYLFHPDPKTILSEVLPLVVKMSVFTAMLENTAGEHAARRLAMKNATDAAEDMIRMLTRQYNRARQSKITQEIAEIVGWAEAL
ncbi:MAG: F0F1 ATP synthase subunit gamma [Planctomycetes bacterium]|nr:F0F1 ATP synthase subunit gamma [Planctomycetota bacterium]